MSKNKPRTSLSDSERNLILKWSKEGTKIAERLEISRQVVSYVLKTYDSTSLSSRKHLSGRKSKLTMKEIKVVHDIAEKNRRISAPKLQNLVAEVVGKQVSSKTIKRYLALDGLKAAIPRRVPLIKPPNKKKRLEFALKYIHKPKSFWESVIWSDETKLNLFSSYGRTWVWRRQGEELSEKCTNKTVKHFGGSIMLWGCMNSRGVGKLVRIDGIMDSLKYVVLLQENLMVSAEYFELNQGMIFQQDNDPKHKSRITSAFFEENHINLLEWPSQSPDINVIEHLWAYIKKKYAESPVTSKADAWIRILNIWSQVPPEFTQRLVDSIYHRLEAVIRSKGGATNY